jgi:hypothetical protein
MNNLIGKRILVVLGGWKLGMGEGVYR